MTNTPTTTATTDTNSPSSSLPPKKENVWIVSDTHFGDVDINTTYHVSDGINTFKARPFRSVEEGDEYMVMMWNDVVQPNDRVYHLGDAAVNKKSLAIFERLNGRKVLVKGNHDTLELRHYAKYFDDVRSFVMLKGCILTHAPLHPMSLGRFGCNVHGHMHHKTIQRTSRIYDCLVNDPNYLNVCVEKTGYGPISLAQVFERISKQDGTYELLSATRESIDI